MFDFNDLLEKAAATNEGRIAAGHLAGEFEHLEKLYNTDGYRDAALIMAAGWAENGSDLRKAATAAWAKSKQIDGDQPDPNATMPVPTDKSNGTDAPDSAAGAAGAGAEPMSGSPEGVADDKKAEKHKHHEKPKGKASVIARLRALAHRHSQPADHGNHSSVAAAYEAGVRDATAKHAGHAHRIGQMASRHSFAMGVEAGHKMAKPVAQGVPGMAIPTQAMMSGVGAMGKAAPRMNDGLRPRSFSENAQGGFTEDARSAVSNSRARARASTQYRPKTSSVASDVEDETPKIGAFGRRAVSSGLKNFMRGRRGLAVGAAAAGAGALGAYFAGHNKQGS